MAEENDVARVESPRDIRRKQPTLVKGTIGVVPNLFEVWAQAIEDEDLSWRQLADAVGFTRSYVQSLCEHETIPWEAFAKVCRSLNLNPEKLIEPVDR